MITCGLCHWAPYSHPSPHTQGHGTPSFSWRATPLCPDHVTLGGLPTAAPRPLTSHRTHSSSQRLVAQGEVMLPGSGGEGGGSLPPVDCQSRVDTSPHWCSLPGREEATNQWWQGPGAQRERPQPACSPGASIPVAGWGEFTNPPESLSQFGSGFDRLPLRKPQQGPFLSK